MHSLTLTDHAPDLAGHDALYAHLVKTGASKFGYSVASGQRWQWVIVEEALMLFPCISWDDCQNDAVIEGVLAANIAAAYHLADRYCDASLTCHYEALLAFADTLSCANRLYSRVG